MSAEPIKDVISLWERNQITEVQVIGKLLLWFLNLYTMLPENRIPTHPGEILLEDFLKPYDLTQVDFAKHIQVPVQRVNEIVRGKRGLTPETAWLFAQALGTTPEFWANLQTTYDLARSRPEREIGQLAVVK